MKTDSIKEFEKKPFSSPFCCISHLFRTAALQNPDKVAVLHAGGGASIALKLHNAYQHGSSSSSSHCYAGDEWFTYSEILSAVELLSRRLRRVLDGADDPYLIKPISGKFPESSDSSRLKLQLSPDSLVPRIVGIYMEPSVEYVVAVLSVLRCGEAFMPLDPSWPCERILSIVASSKANLVIGHKGSRDGDYFHKLDELSWFLKEGCCPVLTLSVKDCTQVEYGSSQLVWPCESERQRLFCYLMYTSGSTGKAKGVCGTEKGLLNRFLWMQEKYPLHGSEHLLFKTQISFIDHLQEVLGPLLTSCMLVIPPFSELKENLFYVVDFLQMYAIDRFIAVPSLLRAVLPLMQNPQYVKIQSSLKLLVLSGEVFDLPLWKMLVDSLPNTVILNLYGSTEVAGDCTYFDCKRLPHILETETLESVPIGLPISNCYIGLGEKGFREGELYVSGQCIAAGYFTPPSIVPLDPGILEEQSALCCPASDHVKDQSFRTGDFARQLQCGNFVFLGRKDRLIKVNGQRVALDEVESTLRGHPNIVDAAVVSSKGPEELTLVEAHVIKKSNGEGDEILMSSIRNWMLSKLPSAMIPTRIIFKESFPMSSSGKVDYTLLANSTFVRDELRNKSGEIPDDKLIEIIQKVFCETLMVEKLSVDDDFFEMGGNSISAAYASYKLGINMKLLYMFPTPLKLQMALVRKMPPNYRPVTDCYENVDTRAPDGSLFDSDSSIISIPHGSKVNAESLEVLHGDDADYPSKCLKLDMNVSVDSQELNPGWNYLKNSGSIPISCALSRCNKVMHGGECEGKELLQAAPLKKVPRDGRVSLQELWKVYMESCVDASPLLVLRGSDIYLFIGSHSYTFLSIDAKTGTVRWKTKLQGRIECSAAILDDFSQVVVGCYQGYIYFLPFLDGGICWTFHTGGEVKSQPVIDKSRHLVWCGSYDQNLYALDYKNYSCIYKVHCGGSIFASPAIDEVRERLFVASTSGQLTAISLKGQQFSISWAQELDAPVFGSLSINYPNGNVICCLVNGNVIALDTSGSTIWKARTGGPIFAGPCMSQTLSSQVLICSRDGSVYSFELEKGDLLWRHALGQPITSSAYVDENLQLESDASHVADRLVSVCTSTGSIHVLRINMDASGEMSKCNEDAVREFAKLELGGDIFSSPVMSGGNIYVGCRDDYVHCISLTDARGVSLESNYTSREVE